MKKRPVLLVAGLCALALCLFAFIGCGAVAIKEPAPDGYEESGGLYYLLNEAKTGYTVCGVAGRDDTAIVIPAKYKEKSVTSIKDAAFANFGKITSVTMPDSVTEIGSLAFHGCGALQSVTLSSSLKRIGDNAFENCAKLTDITLPEGATTIGNHAFAGCAGLTQISIPDSVFRVGNGAFARCGITEAVLSDSVEYLGVGVFEDCAKLEDVTLGKKTDKVSESLFAGCEKLSQVRYSGSVAEWCKMEISGKVIPSGTELYINGEKVSGEFTIPDDVTKISEYAFYGLDSITSLNIGDGVRTIEKKAFEFCAGLTNINFGKQIATIDSTAFYGCNGIAGITVNAENSTFRSQGNCLIEKHQVTDAESGGTKNEDKVVLGCKTSVIPSDGNVAVIGENAFDGCKALTDIAIPDSVTTIEKRAFRGTGLRAVVISENVKRISENAFEYCSELESVAFGKSLEALGASAFFACSKLSGITVNGENKKYYAQGNCLIYIREADPDNNIEEEHKVALGCKTSVIPTDAKVNGIASSAFSGVTGLTTLVLPDNIKSIGERAFESCVGLTSINLGKGLKDGIGSYAFTGCSKLADITYGGTEKDWSKLSKGFEWQPSKNYTVHCTDKNIVITEE